jgi:hypothetical protein
LSLFADLCLADVKGLAQVFPPNKTNFDGLTGSSRSGTLAVSDYEHSDVFTAVLAEPIGAARNAKSLSKAWSGMQ